MLKAKKKKPRKVIIWDNNQKMRYSNMINFFEHILIKLPSQLELPWDGANSKPTDQI